MGNGELCEDCSATPTEDGVVSLSTRIMCSSVPTFRCAVSDARHLASMTGRLTVHTPMQMVGLGLAVGCSVTDKISPLLTASAFRERPSPNGISGSAQTRRFGVTPGRLHSLRERVLVELSGIEP